MKAIKYLIAGLFFCISEAFANKPLPWQMGFQPAASPLAERAYALHDFIMIFVILIVVFVLALLGYVCFKFRESNNAKPSTTTHHTLLEIIWITIPVIILIIIAVPSVKLIFFQEKIPDSEFTLKVVGRQWYWSYEYPDHGDIAFDSYMKQEEDLNDGEPRLLAVDNEIVLPIKTYVRVQVTASDVIHAWAMPALGVKIDAVPGRLNETWLYIDRPGVYYGQCSELCGVYHAFMPIQIRAVSKAEFVLWIEKAKQKFANKESNMFLAKNSNFTNF